MQHYTVVGLGNPGDEYEHTRHNIGRAIVTAYAATLGAAWCTDTTAHARVATVFDGVMEVALILPETFMNRSGGSVARSGVRTDPDHLIVVHDDIDLPLGTVRIAFDRGAGGHNGVRSIERTLRSRAFIRLRVGVVPVSLTGRIKKPRGEDAVNVFLLTKLRGATRDALEAAVPRAVAALQAIVQSGRDAAMGAYNGAGKVAHPPARVVE